MWDKSIPRSWSIKVPNAESNNKPVYSLPLFFPNLFEHSCCCSSNPIIKDNALGLLAATRRCPCPDGVSPEREFHGYFASLSVVLRHASAITLAWFARKHCHSSSGKHDSYGFLGKTLGISECPGQVS